MSSKEINQRKLDHINIINEDPDVDRCGNFFDEINLPHCALPEFALDDVDTGKEFLGKQLKFPLLISSMTGGSGKDLQKINQHLAEAAEAEQVALGLGSQRVMLEDSQAATSFDVRKYAPTTVLCANIGAVQLNYGVSVEQCQQIVDLIEADALFLHLNALQEAIQPEGDTNFGNLLPKIETLVKQLSCPVIVKEVGCGIDLRSAQKLFDIGVEHIDVAGRGGTSWSRIEGARAHSKQKADLGVLFQDWGIPTPEAIIDLAQSDLDLTIIASGGVRNGLDILKAIFLGASLGGIAKPFLEPALHSASSVRDLLQTIHTELKLAMFLSGVQYFQD